MMIATDMDTTTRILQLRPGRERSIRFRHPWVFTGAIARASGPADAALAEVVSSSGEKLASGFHSPHSQIVARLLTFGAESAVSADLIHERLDLAASRRAAFFDPTQTNAWRIAHAEGDRLPALIIDRYGDILVIEIGSRGLEQWRSVVEDGAQRLGARGIVWRNQIPSRKIERLPLEDQVSGEVPERVEIVENGLRFAVDVRGGQKTGLFLDQRENRALVRELAAGRRVLNLFAYTGGFGVYAARGGASSVDEVDVSAPALEGAAVNHDLNGTSASLHTADAFEWTRQQVKEQRHWDLIVCDPPAFARSRGEVDRAARGYKDINMQAIRLCAPGALLATFSCSGHVDPLLFQKIVFGAALDTGRHVSILRRLGAGSDHPVSLDCPEGEYLKGLLLRVE